VSERFSWGIGAEHRYDVASFKTFGDYDSNLNGDYNTTGLFGNVGYKFFPDLIGSLYYRVDQNNVIGNNDMHLKNFSMWLTDQGWALSPAYDLLNVKIILPKDKEDTALLLGGKKTNFNKGYFDRLGEVLKLNEKQINGVFKRMQKWLPKAIVLIEKSFLTKELKEAYKERVILKVQQLEA
jgi:hypothetical protein